MENILLFLYLKIITNSAKEFFYYCAICFGGVSSPSLRMSGQATTETAGDVVYSLRIFTHYKCRAGIRFRIDSGRV